jgi:hypothetical protein
MDSTARVWSRDVDSHGIATEPYVAIDERQGVLSTVNGGLLFTISHSIAKRMTMLLTKRARCMRENELLHKVMEERV